MNRRLYRSRSDVIFAGVAGGVADWLNADPALVRVAWVILTPLTSGLALLVYLVMWVVVPEAPAAGETEPATAASVQTSRRRKSAAATVQEASVMGADAPVPERRAGSPAVVVGIILVVVGAFFLARELIPAFDWGLLWPVALVVVGLALLLGSLRGRT